MRRTPLPALPADESPGTTAGLGLGLGLALGLGLGLGLAFGDFFRMQRVPAQAWAHGRTHVHDGHVAMVRRLSARIGSCSAPCPHSPRDQAHAQRAAPGAGMQGGREPAAAAPFARTAAAEADEQDEDKQDHNDHAADDDL